MANAPTMDRSAAHGRLAAGSPAAALEVPQVRRIGLGDLRDALARGLDDFQAAPTQLVFLGILYPIIGLVLARMAFGQEVLPLLFPLVSGFALVGPIAATGMYELSRRREQGDPVSWLNAFDVLRSPSIASIVAMAVLLLAVFVVWLGAAELIYHAAFGDATPATPSAFLRALMDTSAGWMLIVVGNAVGFLFALLVLTLTAVSLPMLVDRNVGPIVAMRTSARAMATNPVPMLAWGLTVAVLLVLGSIPLFVGLAVVVPVLGHATWHLYRRLVEA